MLGLREHFSDGFVGRRVLLVLSAARRELEVGTRRVQTIKLCIGTTKVDVTDVGGLRGDQKLKTVALWC